ncbi:GATA transcription factor 8 [Lactuca sativa]|uniref:GATA transcription factor n=1 Tax=Lactuca sativa TaxID=4236 RepID=A0A9R1UHX0_LACSA|nr:GATA transcription factor 8 [Lactuca sativa]KAJ0187283.1 hypothetical protein LSAT_V11C900484720 [Lactuca sativa]
MEGQTYNEEIDCGSFFDQIDDFIEFPPVNDTTLNNSIDCNDFADIWTNNSDELQVSDPIFSDSNPASALSAELSVPYEDIIQLEWLSNFVEDSFSGGGMTMNKENIPAKTMNKENIPAKTEPVVVANYHFQMSSPVSVLESSSSSSSSSSCSGSGTGGMMIPLSPTHRGPQRARSKRSRPATFNPRAAIELLSPPNLIPIPIPIPGSMESAIPVEKKRKKKPKKKPEAAQFNPEDNNENGIENQKMGTGQGVRKCMHCEITKTPQWRAGPMGPKTLCNACGVRYKSGRLFPEYRPAASPTFVPSVHSNSHKKVVEMRTKCMPIEVLGSVQVPVGPELIPNPNPLPEYI